MKDQKDKIERKGTAGEASTDYTPPKVTRVLLRPEEAVLGHCKVTGTQGPGSHLPNCVPLGQCIVMGS